MSNEAMKIVEEVADFFVSHDGTYLRVFGCEKSTHLLPRHAPDKVVMQEVTYHLVIGPSLMLQIKKKAT